MHNPIYTLARDYNEIDHDFIIYICECLKNSNFVVPSGHNII